MKRSIMALTIATTLGLISAARADATKRNDSASEKLGIKLSLQCYTFRALTFFETVDKAAALGIRYLEIYPGQKLKPGSDAKIAVPMPDDMKAEVMKKLADAGGLKLVAFGVNEVPKDEKGARRQFEAAKALGIEVLVTETVPNDVHDKLCQETGLRYALHNHPKTWPPDKVLEASKGHSNKIGSCSDVGHWQRADLIPLEQFKKLEGRVQHSHFKDLNEFGGKAHDVPWGTGRADSKALLAELKRQGYKGYLSIEYEYGSVKDLDGTVPKCVAFFDATMDELAK
ncbi:MAG: sugar phosphate isomerase/epimerase family protein [Gemmataceae bacterium]